MTLKICAYCDKPIAGEAMDVTEYSDRGAHPPVWWHPHGDPACWRSTPRAHEEPHIGGVRVDRSTYRRTTGRLAPP